MKLQTLRHISQVYSDASLPVRLHVLMRSVQCPFEAVARHVPRDATVLDIGVGHGVFLHVLNAHSRGRRLVGIDIAENKIRVAQNTLKNGENIAFYTGYLDVVPDDPIHCITLMDSVYLIPPADWEGLLDQLNQRLAPGGMILIKEITKTPWYKYMVSYVQESFSVLIAKIHKGNGLYFKSEQEIRDALTRRGFAVDVKDLSTGHPYAHVLYIARKPAAGN